MEILFSSYRLDQYTNPDGFCLQVGMIFENFPEDVVTRATHPLLGIQRHHKFPPTIEEIASFCERTTRVVDGERLIEERAALGFNWTNDPADNRVGFFNAEGQRWEDRRKQIAAPHRLTPDDKGRLDRALKTSARRLDERTLVLTPDDGRHADRIKEDLDRRRARNAMQAEELEFNEWPAATESEIAGAQAEGLPV